MEDRYFKILEHLSEHGIEQIVDCHNFMFIVFDDISEWEASGYLELMGKNKHINYGYAERFTVYPNPLYLSITLLGVEYLNSYYLKEATLRSFKNQGIYNAITWSIALISIIGTIGMGIYSANQNSDLQRQLNSLKQEIEQSKVKPHPPVPIHKIQDSVSQKHGG